jgi:hypothetical protein
MRALLCIVITVVGHLRVDPTNASTAKAGVLKADPATFKPLPGSFGVVKAHPYNETQHALTKRLTRADRLAFDEKLRNGMPDAEGVLTRLFDSAVNAMPMKLTGEKVKPEIVHLLSMGREASSFLCGTLSEAGIPCLFEPFNGAIEGMNILHDAKVEARFKCLYTEGHEGCGDLTGPEKEQKLTEMWTSGKPAVGYKTTRLINLAGANGIPEDARRHAKAVVMLRDPRAIWASLKPFPGWAVRSVPYVCEASLKKMETIGALQRVLGEANVMPVIVETKMFTRLPEFFDELAAFLSLPADKASAWKAEHPQRDVDLLKWQKNLTPDDISQVESNPQCKEYMQKMGYPLNSDIKSASDYNAVKLP